MNFGASMLVSASFALPYFLSYLTLLLVYKLSRSTIPIFREKKKTSTVGFEHLIRNQTHAD